MAGGDGLNGDGDLEELMDVPPEGKEKVGRRKNGDHPCEER